MKGEILALAALVIFFGAFIAVNMSGEHDWSGADSKAEDVVAQITGGEYKPWYSPIWEPPSGEIESLFFSLQAAIGGLIIGYFLGYYRRAKAQDRRGEETRGEETSTNRIDNLSHHEN